MRFHRTNILETAGDNSLLVGGATEVQVDLSVPKDIHNSNGQGRCRDGTGGGTVDKYYYKSTSVEEIWN